MHRNILPFKLILEDNIKTRHNYYYVKGKNKETLRAVT